MELLIKAVDASHANPVKDQGCYKRGDVVIVMPDGHPWGREEGPPTFLVVKVPGEPGAPYAALAHRQGLGVLRRSFRVNVAGIVHGAEQVQAALLARITEKATGRGGW